MSSNFRKPKLPQSQTETHVSPFVWSIFVGGVILFVGSTFVATWTSTSPVLTLQESPSEKTKN